MTWVRLDDRFPEHEKVMGLPIQAKWLYTTALCQCAANLTDGHLDSARLKVVFAVSEVPRPMDALRALVAAGLVVALPDGAYLIPDFNEYNPFAEKVRAERQSAKDRMKRRRSGEQGGERSPEQTANVRRSFGDPLPLPQAPIALAISPPSVRGRETDVSRATPEGCIQAIDQATGHQTGGITKIRRAAKNVAHGGLIHALEACQGPGVRDPLGVALAELKKRRPVA